MASIVTRKNKFAVVYSIKDENGVSRQKWETFDTKTDAKKRKAEVEHLINTNSFIAPSAKTVRDLLTEYVDLYGISKWAMSTYDGNLSLMNNYILPIIGDVKLDDLTPLMMDQYFMGLLKVRTRPSPYQKQAETYLGPPHIKRIYKLLSSAFNQGVRWRLIATNPALNATLPEVEKREREIWDAETLLHAIDVCEDDILKLALNVAFAGSLRMGEMLALTWDCVDISPHSIERNEAYIYVNKQLQRVTKQALDKLNGKGVVKVFPPKLSSPNTRLVLKEPKTRTSTRRVYLPKTVADMLVERKKEIDEAKEILGVDYHDYNLVFCAPNGLPMEGSSINKALTKLINDNGLPKVVFHSIRHTSTTYKLKWSHGDIKAVQGDTGHSQASMVTERYAHILDADRKRNAERVEEQFYGNSAGDAQQSNLSLPEGISESDQQLVMSLLTNPQALALLKNLAKAL